jgi:hypothetical protein
MAMIMFLFAVAITEATTVHVVHQGSIDGSMDWASCDFVKV